MKHILVLSLLAGSLSAVNASTAFGDLNNFDVVNDTRGPCYGFVIELRGLHTRDLTYTYDWNHYGVPRIMEDNSDPNQPVVIVRYETKVNPDGTFASFTNPQSTTSPIQPTDGHACTDPAVNLGCEHFGVGYYGTPTLVKYNWLVEDPVSPGTLILGPAVQVATPSFVYVPAVPPPVQPQDPPAAPAKVEVVLAPLPPEDGGPDQWGVPVWVKVLKTVQPSGKAVKLEDLLTDDETRLDDANWAGDEAPETEIEWSVFQKRPANKPGEDELLAEDPLPEGDETVTRRYEFYVYNGPANPEDGEAQCSNPDDCPGSVGPYIGAQMAGFNVVTPLGLVDHLQDGDVDVPFVERTLVVGGNTPYALSVTDGLLPDGLTLDPVSGLLSGTPTQSGVFAFTVQVTDADNAAVSKRYALQILAVVPPVNRPPVAACVSLTRTLKACDAPVTAQEIGADSYDPDGDPVGLAIAESAGAVPSTDLVLNGPGTHQLTLTVTDGRGGESTCSATVTLVDETLPEITCPGDVSASTDSGQSYASAVALGVPQTSDNCTVAMLVNDAPAKFPVGTTVVSWLVTDAGGNQATCTQSVVVADHEAPAAPSNLRSAGSARNSLSLAWDAAIDNVATLQYLVFRDGVQISATSALALTDTDIKGGKRHTYYVVAADAAGNLSRPSGSITLKPTH